MYDRVLQVFLRQYEPLKHVNVGYPSPELGQIAPFLVTVSGLINVHGVVFEFETEVDMREMRGPQDLERVAGLLLKSFDDAAAKSKGLN